MDIVEILIMLLVASLCGAVGQALAGYSHGGCLASIALGFIGALLGFWLARALELPELFTIDFGTVQFPIIWSIIGAALFVAVLGLFHRRTRPMD